MAVLQFRKLDFVRDSTTSPGGSGSSETRLVVREMASPVSDGGSIEAEVVGVTGLVQQMVSRFSATPSPNKGGAEKPTPSSWRTDRASQSSDSQNGPVTSPTGIIRQPWSNRGGGGSPTRRSVQWGPAAGQSVHPKSPSGHLDNARPNTLESRSQARSSLKFDSQSDATHSQRKVGDVTVTSPKEQGSGGGGQGSLTTSPVSPVSKLYRLNGLNSGARHALVNGCTPCEGSSEAGGGDASRTETTLPAWPVQHNNDDYNNNNNNDDDDSAQAASSSSRPSFVNRVTLSLSPRTRQSQVTVTSPPCRSPPASSLLHQPTDGTNRSGNSSSAEDGRNLAAGKQQSTTTGLLVNGESARSDSRSGALMGSAGEEQFTATSTSIAAVERDAAVVGSESGLGDESNKTDISSDRNLERDFQTPVKDNDSSQPETSSATLVQDDVASVQKDGHYFLGLVKTEEDKINSLCVKAEADLDGPISEEASGRLRATVGKAHLLTTKKFEQFRELCHQNLNQSSDEQFQTTVEDLAGFWDLIMIQIDDVHSMFADIETLRRNNWKELSPVTNGFVSSPKKKKVPTATLR